MTGEYVKISWCIKCLCLDLCFSDGQNVSQAGVRWGEVASRSNSKGQCNSMRYWPETESCLSKGLGSRRLWRWTETHMRMWLGSSAVSMLEGSTMITWVCMCVRERDRGTEGQSEKEKDWVPWPGSHINTLKRSSLKQQEQSLRHTFLQAHPASSHCACHLH